MVLCKSNMLLAFSTAHAEGNQGLLSGLCASPPRRIRPKFLEAVQDAREDLGLDDHLYCNS